MAFRKGPVAAAERRPRQHTDESGNRLDGKPHLSECLMVEHPDYKHCTCHDDSPDWD